MRVIAWSENLPDEAADRAGVHRVEKATLLAEVDYLFVHLVLSDCTRGILGAAELAAMKPGAWLVNASRGRLACPIHRCENVGLSRRGVSSWACGSARRGAPSGDASVWVRRWREDLISA